MLLRVKEVKKFGEFMLVDEKTSKEYSLRLGFYDIEKPEEGDEIMLHKKLLDRSYEGYAQPYFFAPIDSKFGKSKENLQDEEIIGLVKEGKTDILKRVYG